MKATNPRKSVDLKIYNPNLQSDEDFLRGFVARHRIVKIATQRLLEIPKSGLASHFIFLGQRGMGKSSMLRRLSIEIDQNKRLSEKFFALAFREEQYNIHSIDLFWENCLDSLGDWFEKYSKLEYSTLIDARLGPNKDSNLSAKELFDQWVAKVDRRPILLLDNLDIILDGLGKDQWELRNALQDRTGPVVLGAAAAYMEELSICEAAFFDFFQVIVLEKLTQNDIQHCLKKIAAARGERGKEVLELLQRDPGRVRALSEITGGNPRTLTLLYLLFESDASADIFQDLENLLDEVTVLYKARVEDLPSQARVVFDALALNWDPITAHELAKLSRLQTSAVSTQLDRLQTSSLVERVSIPKTKRAAFQVSERFFNIWYLMRHAPRRQRVRLRWLIEFLKVFYSPSQLTERAAKALKAGSMTDRDLDIYFALSGAIEDRAWAMLIGHKVLINGDESQRKEEWPTPKNSMDWRRQAELEFYNLNESSDALNSIEKAIDLDPKDTTNKVLKARILWNQDGTEAANEFLSKIPEALDNGEALCLLTWLNVNLNAKQTARTYIDKALEVAADEPRVRYEAAHFFRHQTEKKELDRAKIHYEKSIELNPEAPLVWEDYAAFLDVDLGEISESYEVLVNAIEKFPERLQTKVSLAWFLTKNPSYEGPFEALSLLKPAIDTMGDHRRQAFSVLSRYFDNNDQFEELVKLHENEIVLDPRHDNVITRSFLGKKYLSALNDKKAAIRHFELGIKAEANSSRELQEQGYLSAYLYEDFSEALKLYKAARALEDSDEDTDYDLTLESNILALEALLGERPNDFEERKSHNAKHHEQNGLHVINAIFALSEDNVGVAIDEFIEAMNLADSDLFTYYQGFIALFLRTCFRRQYLTKIIERFELSGASDRFLPVYRAILALRDGEDSLLEVNPEARSVAAEIFRWVDFLE